MTPRGERMGVWYYHVARMLARMAKQPIYGNLVAGTGNLAQKKAHTHHNDHYGAHLFSLVGYCQSLWVHMACIT